MAGKRPSFEAPWPCAQTREYYHHSTEVPNALDFNTSNDMGTPVLASAAGTVISARMNSGYGNEVVIDHGKGWATRVAHLSKFSVMAGQRVTIGQEVGNVGSTGNSSGPHLHYEQIADGVNQRIVLHGEALSYPPFEDPLTVTSHNCGGNVPSLEPAVSLLLDHSETSR